jgi:hypothetical protein
LDQLRLIFITWLFLLSCQFAKAQSPDTSFAEPERKIIDTIEEPIAKWPYYGQHIPPYLALTGGIETIHSHYFFGGLSWNMLMTTVENKGTALIGLRTYYKQNMNDRNNYAFETDLCLMSTIAIGFNYNYMHIPGHNISGFKPFIGISFVNVQFYYGYCFYKNGLDPEKRMVHNRFTISFNLPVLKLTKTKTLTHYKYEKDPWDQD